MTDRKDVALAPAKARIDKLSKPEQAKIANEILSEYLDGAKVADSAARRGISTSAAYTLLVKHSEQDFKDAQIAKALATLDEADTEMETAKDGFTLARGEKRSKSAQWTLERLLRRLYGQREDPISVTPVIIQIASLRGPAGAPAQSIKVVGCDTVEEN